MNTNFSKSCVITLCLILGPVVVFAMRQYTKISRPGYSKLPIYSEYYPNSHAKFKGTIIFENGSGTPLTEWTQNKKFFGCVRQLGNLFMYDRSGLGKSPGDLSMSQKKPMTAKLINIKLMQLLKSRKIRPPYILVAHSYGSLYAGYFARKFPALIRGILMVDPSPPKYEWSIKLLDQAKPAMKIMNKLKGKQLYNAANYPKDRKYKHLFVPLYFQLLGFKQTKQQISNLPKLSGKIPIIILSSSYTEVNAPIKGDWYNLQKQWLNKNLSSKILKVKSGHFIQQDRPRFVCYQLKKVVALAVN